MAVERELTPWTCDFKCSLCGLYTRRVTVCRPCLDVLDVRTK